MWPFSKRNTQQPAKLIYEPEEFFALHCRHGNSEIREKYGLVALVETGADSSITEEDRSRDGSIQTVSLRVVSADGGFEVIAQPMCDGPLLHAGDCVLWVPYQYDEQRSLQSGDPRSGWVGVIVAKIAPEIDPANGNSSILHKYASEARDAGAIA